MKALLYTKPYCLEYSDFTHPVIGDDEVLVSVKACGICGSDVQGFTGKTGRRIPPLIMGHEAAGVVEETGENVKGFEKGDRVCFDSTVYCNKCQPCRMGLYNRCEKRQVLGVSTPEFKRHGAFAEYVTVPWWIVSKIPDDMSFVQSALLEPASIGTHAANRAPISTDDTVVVIGAGTIGLFILQAARLRGAAKVIVADINEFRLEVAGKLGADKAINPLKSDLRETIFKETKNRGADVTFEAVGYAQTFRDGVSLTKTGGHLVAVGNLEKTAEFNLQELVARELTFTGSYASSGEFRDCINLVASGKINVEPLISNVLPLKDGPSAFERLLKAEENLLKIVLEP
ncbi:MAG: galactitol-1-phosphate 5-dehydrogenase [Candidatus Desulfatibia sp.]|jgi:L-iditol 2-dehydrogenase|uniref:zinc-dependent alcohol dehydrogenase n=1 Tax=Candidatus Desulfatibia sp. TaxID=3101189 RepID=UPI002F343D03